MRFGRRQHPVREHRYGELLDVVRQHELPCVERGGRAGRPDQVQRRPRAGAQPELLRAAGRADQRNGVLLHRLRHVHRLHRLHQAEDLLAVGDRLEVRQRVVGGVPVEHPQLGGRLRVAHRDAGHEAVALRLGQRVGALHLDRVLGRDDHERRFEVVRRGVDGDLALLHRLQQRGLGLRRGAVDLVADDDVREHRAGLELEVADLLVEDRDAGDVRRQQVRRELDPAHGAVDRLGQRLGQHRLTDARHVLDQQMPLGQQDGDGDFDDVGFALDHGLDGPADPARHLGQLVEVPGSASGELVAVVLTRCPPHWLTADTFSPAVGVGPRSAGVSLPVVSEFIGIALTRSCRFVTSSVRRAETTPSGEVG